MKIVLATLVTSKPNDLPSMGQWPQIRSVIEKKEKAKKAVSDANSK